MIYFHIYFKDGTEKHYSTERVTYLTKDSDINEPCLCTGTRGNDLVVYAYETIDRFFIEPF